MKELTIQDIEAIVHRDENRVMEAKTRDGGQVPVPILKRRKVSGSVPMGADPLLFVYSGKALPDKRFCCFKIISYLCSRKWNISRAAK